LLTVTGFQFAGEFAMLAQNDNNPRANRLLAALPAAEYERLLPYLESVHMEIKFPLYEPDVPIEYVYFPIAGVASILAVMADGTLVEVGTIGNEGMVGIPVFLGTDRTNGVAFWQVPGAAMRMKADVLRAEIRRGGPLVTLLQRYTQTLFVMLAQHTACNRIHPINERCARWLLMCHDRVGEDQFQLTQEFLGEMLGVRRASVNMVMQTLQNAGYIQYARGVITVLDRAGLESAACECYRIIRDEYDRLLG
jgi:CRP-like cAMP-binding protein